MHWGGGGMGLKLDKWFWYLVDYEHTEEGEGGGEGKAQPYSRFENDGVCSRWSRCSDQTEGPSSLQGHSGCVGVPRRNRGKTVQTYHQSSQDVDFADIKRPSVYSLRLCILQVEAVARHQV